MSELGHEAHFDSLARQVEATRVFMWVFLASEVLLFTALITLYAGYRVHYPAAFAEGVHHSLREVGTLNTAVLLVSSYLVARAVLELEHGHAARAAKLTWATASLGLVFLGLKAYEYSVHIGEGLLPWAALPGAQPGAAIYHALYFLTTGAHAVHVMIGITVLLVLGTRAARGRLEGARAHHLELGALYWHLVDVVWIVLWPLYYLARDGG